VNFPPCRTLLYSNLPPSLTPRLRHHQHGPTTNASAHRPVWPHHRQVAGLLCLHQDEEGRLLGDVLLRGMLIQSLMISIVQQQQQQQPQSQLLLSDGNLHWTWRSSPWIYKKSDKDINIRESGHFCLHAGHSGCQEGLNQGPGRYLKGKPCPLPVVRYCDLQAITHLTTQRPGGEGQSSRSKTMPAIPAIHLTG